MRQKVRDTLLFLVVLAGCVLLTLALSEEDIFSPAAIYNFAFLGIMALLYIIALLGGFFRMANATSYFRRSAARIDDMKEGAYLEDEIHDLQTWKPMNQSLDRFLEDIRRSHSGICDIEDYINEDETDSLIHKRMLDLVPDMLTSLGILGTFVGLVWGLRSFQPSTYETMTSSVASLVDGIKVAFMTSIYGLILSLVCSYSLRTGYTKMNDALHLFLDRFHTRLVPSAEMEAQNRLISNQKEQNDLMRSLTREFSDQVAHGFAANMAPTLERINEQLGSMMTSISTNQQMFLQDIVDAFVREMHSSFSTEFERFGETINTLSEMTNQNMMYSQQLCQQITEEMRNVFVQDEDSMHAAVADIAAMQAEMKDCVSKLSEQTEKIMNSYAHVQEETLANLSRSEQESARFWVACNQTMQNYLKEAADAYGKFKEANASTQKVLSAITLVYRQNEKVLEDSQTRLKEMQTIQASMNASLEEIKDVFSQIQVAGTDGKRIILYPGMSARVSKESEQRILKQTDSMIRQSEERQGEKLDGIKEELDELNERTAKKSRWF